ncbi:PREDICTED: putative F-box/LRR-repeat/kelch-repeat protein At1g11620 [Camelina sativa]|uniref:F-box/LRR-repeat/kelch-repeat protein At1g11620 n=1 Tax=Camelina sativa TaxID=90675 RepID=A0ABM0SKZ0_CAMSA|nr:PREDICTED: putative F-box/LRR-repeat/kelch-repeat protein At1g11620 [Camelina sativa]
MEVTLPRDLEDEILSRVPDKSLARFRCGCKQWNTQLVEETFLEQHSSRMHNYSGCGEDQIIIKGARNRINSVASPSLTVQNLTLINKRLMVHEFGNRVRVYKIVHCTGLLLCVMENQLLVWNPFLKVTRWVKCSSDFHRFDDAYGIGFIRQSPTQHNYKIVRFRCPHNSRDRPPRIEVYEFLSNRWKVITNHISFDWHLRVPLSGVSLGGNSYWIGLREDSTAFIQCFDFSKERFQPLGHLPFRFDEC